jgi:hypothetical protein
MKMEYMTLLEASKLTQDSLRSGIIEIFPRSSAVLERLPFFSISGNSYKYNQEKELPSIGFRGLNESYTPDIGVLNPVTESLVILGGISQVDRALVKSQGSVNSLRAIHDGQKAKAASLEYTRCFFKGDSETNNKEFDGLQKRLTNDQVLDMDGTLTLSKLDELIDSVQGSPDVLFMNKTLRRKVNALMRAAGQATETVSDAFGRQINSYAGIPIGIIEQDALDEDILSFDETGNTASIYACRFGFEWLSGLQNGSIDVEDLGLVETMYKTLIEWLTGVIVWHGKSAARLKGITNT